ncbi:uncharacterized protein LOC128242690 [Mya arenaria]|uniref:uncharacterized protein LOC128242690 n=1 Tax=Mya arenaria TaxID=6604 RepID=UPI0022E98057|nr:uncharacterized protein LOC128242690 [Mya arenaria]XP_052815905.1 uncharacterized protein LOC128242690 [Mya arenaria]
MAQSYFNENTPDVVLRSLFAKYDADQSGQIGRDELSTLLTTDLGMTDSQAEVYIHLLDKDGSSSVCFDEFKQWLRSDEKLKSINDQARYHVLCKAVEMFKKYDTDESQSISSDEFEELMNDLGASSDRESDFKAIGNGKISFPEFLKWLKWLKV